ncbi:hypothetical protein REPUB_Repub02eG0041500 [Reevesia pubescens]
MCSNNITSNNVGVRGNVGNDASGMVDDHGDYESSCLRKAKKQRIPKRRPGVAELEKIFTIPPLPPMTVPGGNFHFIDGNCNGYLKGSS